jgi:hypothetical protein
LFGVVGIFFVLGIYRAIHFWMTAFFVPDEFGYFSSARAIQKVGEYFLQ